MVDANILEQFRVGKDGVALSELQFVDDMMFFALVILNHILGFFEDMSSVRISRSKCCVIGLNCVDEKLRRWVEMVGIAFVLPLPWSSFGQ